LNAETSVSYRLILALAIGALGGALFHVLNVPLAWMLGAMAFNIIACLHRWPVFIPEKLRSLGQGLLGVFLGSSFSPQTALRIQDWPLSLMTLAVFTVLTTLIITYYYRRKAGFDLITALFSATPGGMSAMIFVGGESGGDERHIALTHSLRVVLVVFLLPPLVIALAPGEMAKAAAPVANAVGSADPLQWIVLVGGAVVGLGLARLLRLPVPQISGTMFVTALLYLTGWVSITLPGWLLEATLWILGSSVGARFAGVTVGDLFHTGRYTLGAALIMMLLTALFSTGLFWWLGIDYWAAFLAFAPGGVAEMSTMAVALDIDPTFVAFHHLFRIFLILLTAPLVGRWIKVRFSRLASDS
jgi:membrane AbrB-like protein